MHLCQKFWWKGWVFEACLNDVLESEWWRLYGESFKIEGLTHKNYLWPNALEPEWGILRMRVSAEEWRSLEGVCRWMTEWTNEWWFMMRLKTSTEVEEVQRSVVVQCLCRVLKRLAHDVMPLPPCSHVGSLFKTSLWERLQDRKWQCSQSMFWWFSNVIFNKLPLILPQNTHIHPNLNVIFHQLLLCVCVCRVIVVTSHHHGGG